MHDHPVFSLPHAKEVTHLSDPHVHAKYIKISFSE